MLVGPQWPSACGSFWSVQARWRPCGVPHASGQEAMLCLRRPHGREVRSLKPGGLPRKVGNRRQVHTPLHPTWSVERLLRCRQFQAWTAWARSLLLWGLCSIRARGQCAGLKWINKSKHIKTKKRSDKGHGSLWMGRGQPP